MRNLLWAMAAGTTFLVSAPAMASVEGRVLLRGSYDSTEIAVKDGGENSDYDTGSDIGYGVAAGIDFDAGRKIFAGVELGIDDSSISKNIEDIGRLSAGRDLSLVARLGVKVGKKDVKIYGLGGYSNIGLKATIDGESESSWDNAFVYGAGVEVPFSKNFAASLEYRRASVDINFDEYDVDDVNYNKSRVAVGLSYRF